MNKVVNYWHKLEDGRLQCDLCPRACRLKDGQQGMCFVRAREGEEMVLTTYGRSSGFCIDPVEKKPLNHFYPGTAVLSFGTAGCNLGCRFCQNWDISKAREFDRLADEASPEAIANAAIAWGCKSIAYTYNDPVIFLEYAVDIAAACREKDIKSIAVTAGYINSPARQDFFSAMDAANIDLKAFTDDFYRKRCLGDLQTCLDTIQYVRHETDVWLELTTLLIPGENDSDRELKEMCSWVYKELGPDVPMHFTAFHPDFKMRDIPATPPETLSRARQIALDAGIHYAYTGNTHDKSGASTYCANCQKCLIGRDWYVLSDWHLQDGACEFCGSPCAGHFDAVPGDWGPRRQPIHIS